MERHVAAFILLLAIAGGVRTYHYSWWSDNPQPYLDAIRKSSLTAPPTLAAGEKIRAGIVTHHFLASGLMVKFFKTLAADSSPETIILIGPNHFHHGLANISLSSLPWKTPFGVLETDRGIVQQLKAATGLPEDPEAFAGEHSVGVLVPFVKYYFPHTRVVTILVDVNAQENSVHALQGLLAGFLRNPQIVVVLSMDFSHDSNAPIADARDEHAQQVISAWDLSKVKELNVDCPKGLWLLLSAMKDIGTIKVQVSEHTNSARLTQKLSQPNVTSYFSIFFTK
jgi:hypothetical protein